MIRKAIANDIPALEELYKSRVLYNDAHDIHQWCLHDVTWDTLSKQYTIEDFYILEEQGNLCAAMCLVDFDPVYWPEIPKGESLFLHKICVSPSHAKKGYADALIEHFKDEGARLHFSNIRLDVRAHKDKLRNMYERRGFFVVEERSIFKDYKTALYIYKF